MKTYSVAFIEEVHQQLANHLIRIDGQEDLCFATYVPSQGTNRFSGLISSFILPLAGERFVHGNVSFTAAYVERALQIAAGRGEGLVFLHSHPSPGWQFMSRDDVKAEIRLSPGALAVTGLPLLGMTIGNDGIWSARFWQKHPTKRRHYNRQWCTSVRVVGSRLKVSYQPGKVPLMLHQTKLLRTISAWGEKAQKEMTQLTVGIVGLGSVGSMVAEMLARKGFSKVVLIDFDRVEEKNLDRLMNVFTSDIGDLKVRAVARGMRRSKTAERLSIWEVPYSVCEEEGYRAALTCDVLFSCVDRPWPREVLNVIAYAHLIPVIDGGIKVITNQSNTEMKSADWKVQTVGPGRPCLEQWGQYTSDLARLERDGFLDDPNYIEGMEGKSVVEAKENVFAFSANLASLEIMQLICMVVAPAGEAWIGQQIYHLKNGSIDVVRGNPFPTQSFCQKLTGKGDRMGFMIFGRHLVAEQMRKSNRL